jgi:Fur family ferric uptake transcriptional regulator
VFVSAQAVHADLVRDGGSVGLSTVYRSLHALAERGTLDAVRGQDGEMLYRKCLETSRCHHHLVCRRCGEAVEIPGAAVLEAVEEWARRAGFVDTELVVEAFGTCSTCAATIRDRQ